MGSAGRSGRCAALGVLPLVLALSACGIDELEFKNDRRLEFTQPESREIVATPFEISWEMSDFKAVGLDGSAEESRGAFVVFVDKAPMAAGEDLDSLTEDDPTCIPEDGCPSLKYLRQRDVYVTQEPSVTIRRLPEVSGVGREQHFVNVVLVDGQGRRIGESGWYLQFQTERRSS